MTKTEHYQLNQWDAGDRVLRTDFNADNAALDAALHGLAQRGMLTKLKSFTVDQTITGTATFDMDVSDIDWGAWQLVYADFALKGSGYMLLYPNGDREGAISSGYITSNSYDSLAGLINCDYAGKDLSRAEFQIFCRGEKPLQVVCPFEKITGWSDYTYNELKSLHLTPSHESYSMESGSTVTFWGLR